MRVINRAFRRLVPKLREKGFYKSQEKRSIKWKNYNLSQINEVKILDKITSLVDFSKLRETKSFGRPLTNPKDLSKAILVAELLSLPERQAQGWINLLASKVGITSFLDDRTIGRAYNRLEVLQILKQVFEQTKTCDGVLSGDGTGIETTRKQNYETEKKKTENYLVSIVDSREIVQAFEMNNKECPAMHSLILSVKGDILCLDAGFVDRELTKKISELGMKPFIFPKKNLNLNGSIYWKAMFLDLFYKTQEWLRIYHQRSHAESFHSSFKRKNKPLMKFNSFSKLVQLTARIIIHNLRKQEYYSRM
ncbi:MAG: transposase [Nanoarchaeota archaeon]